MPAPACYVVHLMTYHGSAKVESPIVRIDCLNLPDGHLETKQQILEDLRGVLRGGPDASVCSDVKRIAERNGLPGFAFLSEHYGEERQLIPPPIEVLFEPVRLDETDPAFAQLVHALDITRDGEAFVPRPSRPQRMWVRAGIPLLTLAALAAIVWPLAVSPVCMTLVGVFLMVALIWWLWRRKQWVIIPGAVCLGMPVQGRIAGTRILTPDNALLHVRRQVGSWYATLTDGVHTWNRGLTDFECVVLLAAWQSPVRAIDRLVAGDPTVPNS
jgi:hypothetical protein